MLSINCLSFTLPTLARCDLPIAAVRRLSVVNVGYLAHGPDEKYALSGRITGFFMFIYVILTDICPSLGRGVPPISLKVLKDFHKIDLNVISLLSLVICSVENFQCITLYFFVLMDQVL